MDIRTSGVKEFCLPNNKNFIDELIGIPTAMSLEFTHLF